MNGSTLKYKLSKRFNKIAPSLPTLFGLDIDNQEGWINMKGEGGVNIACIIIQTLLYADDVILIAKTNTQSTRASIIPGLFAWN